MRTKTQQTKAFRFSSPSLSHFPKDLMESKELLDKEKIQNQLLKLDLLKVKFSESQDTLAWSTYEGPKKDYCRLEVAFARPIKSMEKIQSSSSSSPTQWVAFYNGQLSNILVGIKYLPRSNFTLQAYILTQKNNKIVRIAPLIDNKQHKIIKEDNIMELIGLKFNKPEKITQKKECIHHIVICALKNDSEIIGLSLCTGFFLKSRKKSHQQKGLDTRFFKPGDLQQEITQKKGKVNNVLIKNSMQGLNDYFTSPNIRHKIVNPFFLSYKFSNAATLYLSIEEFPNTMKDIDVIKKIFCEFATIRPEGCQQYSLALVLSDNSADDKKQTSKNSKDNADKAFFQAKTSKCLFVRLSSEPQWIQMNKTFYPYQISTSKDREEKLYKDYVQVYNSQSAKGHPELNWSSDNPPRNIIQESEVHLKDDQIDQKQDQKGVFQTIFIINQRNRFQESSLSSSDEQKPMIQIPVLRKIPSSPPQNSAKCALLNSEESQQLPTEKQEYPQNEQNYDCRKKIKIDQDAASFSPQPNELHASLTSIGQNNYIPEAHPSLSGSNNTNNNNNNSAFNCYQLQAGQSVEIGQIKVEESSQEQQQYPSSSSSKAFPSYFPNNPQNLKSTPSNSQQQFQQNQLQYIYEYQSQQQIPQGVSLEYYLPSHLQSYQPYYINNTQYQQLQFYPQEFLLKNLEYLAWSRNQSYFPLNNIQNNQENNTNKL